MTGHKINSLVGDLVAMAHAMEKLPQVEAELQERDNECAKHLDTIQDRELRILDLKAELEAKSNTIRELEVAKDAAETMFLEADDRTARALEFVKAQFGAAGSLIQALEPPRAEPPKAIDNPFYGDPQPEPVVSEVKPIESPLPASTEAMPQSVPSTTEHTVADTTSAQGQSEPGPTILPVNASDPDTNTHSIMDASVNGVASTGDASIESSCGSTTPPSPGPYSNKRYYDHPIYVSSDDWLAGGGTEADYHWRPSYDYSKAPF